MPQPQRSTLPGDPGPPTAPPVPVLATSFLLAGLGTVVLGPLLPRLLTDWQLSDQRGGLLLLAKFLGAFAGGATVPLRLRRGILAGHLLAAVGFAVFALAQGLGLALPALFLSGLGLGQIIASTNILTGRRWPTHTGSALALLNFFWSFGAVSTGLLVAALLPHVGWRRPVLALAASFAATGALTAISTGRNASPDPVDSPAAKRLARTPVALPIRLRFGGLLFLYGGLETCLTAWLSTFSLRFAGGHLLGGQSGFVVLWAALTVGRALASALMRRFPERRVQRVSLLLCFVFLGGIATAHTAGALALSCILLGLALAPVFPSTFALLLRHPMPPRVAGLLLAVSGLGAAVFPWMMGAVSTGTGSLRLAMVVPALLIPLMLLLTRGEPSRPSVPRLFSTSAAPPEGEESVKSTI